MTNEDIAALFLWPNGVPGWASRVPLWCIRPGLTVFCRPYPWSGSATPLPMDEARGLVLQLLQQWLFPPPGASGCSSCTPSRASCQCLHSERGGLGDKFCRLLCQDSAGTHHPWKLGCASRLELTASGGLSSGTHGTIHPQFAHQPTHAAT